VPVDQVAELVDIGWRETVGIGLVVGQLGVDVVVDVPLFKRSQSDKGFGHFSPRGKTHNVLQGGGTPEGVVLELGQEVLGLIGLFLEIVRAVDPLDVLFESLWIRC